jgi:hypothetical protein
MARSIALVASVTDWISLVSTRTSSIFFFLPETELRARPVVLALRERHRAEDGDLDDFLRPGRGRSKDYGGS